MALVNSDPFLKYLPSEVASSSVCLARHTLDQQPAWVYIDLSHFHSHYYLLHLLLLFFISLANVSANGVRIFS